MQYKKDMKNQKPDIPSEFAAAITSCGRRWKQRPPRTDGPVLKGAEKTGIIQHKFTQLPGRQRADTEEAFPLQLNLKLNDLLSYDDIMIR